MAVVINYDAEYHTVIKKAAKVLGIKAKSCSLVHTNGSRIVDEYILVNERRRVWSIGKYLESVYARTSGVRLGLFPEDECAEVYTIICMYETEMSGHAFVYHCMYCALGTLDID